MARWEYTAPVSDLTEAQVVGLWERFVRERDQETRDALLEHYMPLVYQTAERMAGRLPSFIDVNDLISAGTIGLIDAVNRFDPTQNVKFSTYSNQRISGAIFDELRRLDWAPRLVRSRVNQLERGRQDLESRLGREPTDEEMAAHLECSAEEFAALRKETQVKSMVSLDRKWDEDDDHELGQLETLPDSRAKDPLSELARAEIKEVAIKGLSEKEQMVLVLYYYENLSLKEIGVILELSESRVCQIHAQTLEFLREKFNQREISTLQDV
jgi:RNA polymerase sigma factor FliA